MKYVNKINNNFLERGDNLQSLLYMYNYWKSIENDKLRLHVSKSDLRQYPRQSVSIQTLGDFFRLRLFVQSSFKKGFYVDV